MQQSQLFAFSLYSIVIRSPDPLNNTIQELTAQSTPHGPNITSKFLVFSDYIYQWLEN